MTHQWFCNARPTFINTKILGVVMDCELRYKQHIARTAAKGLAAALALRRLKMLSPRTARQLFVVRPSPLS